MVQILRSSRFLSLLAGLLAALLFTGAAAAQPASPVSIRVVAQKDAAHPGDQFAIAVVLDHAEGFHTWPSTEVKLPESVNDFAIRTEIGIADKPSWIEKVVGIQWPEAKPGKVADPSGEKPTIELPLYSHKAVAFILVKIAADAKPGDQAANIRVAWQSCNDQMCTPPEDKTFPVTLKVVAAGAPDGKPQEVGLFAGFDAAKASKAAAKPADQPAAAEEVKDVAVRVMPQAGEIRAGDSLVVAVIIDHAPDFHSWPAAGVALPKAAEESAIRTQIKVAKADWIDRIDGIQWPEAKPGKVADPSGENPTIDAPLYSGRAIAYVKVTTRKDAAPGPHEFKITTSYQACNSSMCLQPRNTELPVKVAVVTGTPAAPNPADSGIFTGFKPESLKPIADAAAGIPMSDLTKAQPIVVPSSPTFFGYSFGGGVLVLFLVAALGGFILNLTPCVLPVIPIKVLTLTQHAGSHGRALVLGLWMALGVVAFWTLAGVPMALISRGLDPSRYIFGVWWIALAIGLIIAVLGLGIMGLFSINLPQSVYVLNPKVDNPWGSFLFGILTAVLGLPCFGFVAGGLLAGASALPSTTIMIVFIGLGVGMAAPYLVLSAKPQLLKFLPKTGPASDLVKQVMGLLLLAAAAFFVGAGIRGVLTKHPYLSESMNWWAVTFFVLVAGAWLTVRTFQISKVRWPKVVMPALAAIALLGFGVFTYGLSEIARQDYERKELAHKAAGSSGGADPVITGAWVEYTPERLQKALAAGKIVVVDFTASWCINCKALKRTVLDRDPVRSRIVNDRTVLLEVDCTDSGAPGWDYLKSLGQTGVPTLAIYGPSLAKPVIMNAYAPANVLSALDKADGTTASASRIP